MARSGSLPGLALVNAALIGVVLQAVALRIVGAADLFGWISGSTLVAVALWALQEDDKLSLPRRLLDWLSLQKLSTGARGAISSVLAALAVYLTSVPVVTLRCESSGAVTIAPEGRSAWSVECRPGRTVVAAPAGFVPTWRPGVTVSDFERASAHRVLGALTDNAVTFPADMKLPTCVVAQLPPAETISADAVEPVELSSGCTHAKFCAKIDGVGEFAVPKNGISLGRRRVSGELLDRRLRALSGKGALLLEPGEPVYHLTDKLRGKREIRGRVERSIEGTKECWRFSCLIEAEEENLCILGKRGAC